MKTKKIRISVVILPDGKWNAVGADDLSESKSFEYAHENLSEFGAHEHIIEAEIPIPDSSVIQGYFGNE